MIMLLFFVFLEGGGQGNTNSHFSLYCMQLSYGRSFCPLSGFLFPQSPPPPPAVTREEGKEKVLLTIVGEFLLLSLTMLRGLQPVSQKFNFFGVLNYVWCVCMTLCLKVFSTCSCELLSRKRYDQKIENVIKKKPPAIRGSLDACLK